LVTNKNPSYRLIIEYNTFYDRYYSRIDQYQIDDKKAQATITITRAHFPF